uniref:WH2 domain-containing protein n=1 Tax=Romanomermis culicivorax TaxID=13658 RepID=A0A915KYI2_ROMCU
MKYSSKNLQPMTAGAAMSPPYGECVVVNSNSAIDNLNTISPPDIVAHKSIENRKDDGSTTIESILLKSTEIRQKIVEAIIIKTGNLKNPNFTTSKLKTNYALSNNLDEKLMEELGKLSLEKKTGDLYARSQEKICRSPPMKSDRPIYSSATKAKFEEKSTDGDSAFYGDEEILSATLSGLSLKGDKPLEKSSIIETPETKGASNGDKENEKNEIKTEKIDAEKSLPQAENVKKISSGSSVSAPVKRQFIKPKDIINSSRQKSLILAHKSKTASAPQVPQDVVTQDLLGTNLKKCRDNKNVDELAKALTELHVRKTSGAGQQQLLVDDRIQRSPIPVQVVPNRRASAAPYNTDSAASRNRSLRSIYDGKI